jgi:hypothetical protein
MKNNSFFIQVDGSTDFTNKSYVVAFVRFVNDDDLKKKSVAKSCPKQAKAKIYLMSCLHIWKQ